MMNVPDRGGQLLMNGKLALKGIDERADITLK